MFKVIIAGSRHFRNYELLEDKTHHLLQNKKDIEIVSGGARGADKLGERFADYYDLKIAIFPANWDVNGRKAGYLRNRQMATYADALIAFWDGQSKGTKHID